MISNNSILSVNSENHVVLSCAEPTGVPSSGVVWTKDGVEMSENVRKSKYHCTTYHDILMHR